MKLQNILIYSIYINIKITYTLNIFVSLYLVKNYCFKK